MMIDKKVVWLGRFNNEEEAADAYANVCVGQQITTGKYAWCYGCRKREEPLDNVPPHSNSNTKDITAAFSRFSVGVKVDFKWALAKVNILIETAANVNVNQISNNPYPNHHPKEPYLYPSQSQTAAADKPAEIFGTKLNCILKPLLPKSNSYDLADKRCTASK